MLTHAPAGDAINDKLAKSGGEKTLREDRAAALAAQRDELDAKIEQNSARLDELLTQRAYHESLCARLTRI